MGYLDRAIVVKSPSRIPNDKPQVRIYNFGFNINSVAVKAIDGKCNDYFDLRYIPEDKLIVLCKAEEGCHMNGSKGVYFSRSALRKSLDNIIPRVCDREYPTYAIDGEYVPEENIILFDVKKAKKV